MEIVLTGKGGPEMLAVRDDDAVPPGRGEVRVRVEASGVSFAEVQMLRGRYPMQPKFPFVPGYDLVGTVTEVGAEVRGVRVGDRVAAMTRTGAWRSHVVVRAADVVPVPAAIESGTAAAVVMNGVTAWQMTHQVARVRSGQTVLVHGASGGVGSLLVRLAVRAGARVLGTASASKHDAVRALGAEPIDYRAGDVPARVRELAPGGVDAVFDHVGGRSLVDSYDLLADGGVLVSYGSASTLRDEGHWLRPYLGTIATFAGWRVRRLVGRGRGRRATFYYVKGGASFAEALRQVFDLVERGELEPTIEARYPLEKAALALGHLVDGSATGKIVLEA
ncbi:medium chain dehydrogenase/reductase family protein [Actinophytocola gossypii]|uniref:Zinc-binding dehydrogenase n=1 Tax=Actinophytocola gossypii TaxID=2812003 RepID=A0ABT2JFF8_9PSEU|nr:medium chain dehydrogenase/reductase family protein [Actinophytocola gossypii]MCT2586264.1 zinc-binding dehydrogenase [Actinophytocola gossypii]